MVNKNLHPTMMIKKARKAIREAVRKTLSDHKAKGLPIFVWKDDRVVRIPAQQISSR
jgi:hypothetical protein